MQAAVLLLGPTGSGKSPLGDHLQEKGLFGRRCFHFDFGANLRACAESDGGNEFLSASDIDFLKDVLATGRLLEDEHFYIAEGILKSFISRNGVTYADYIVMNGLPRHVGQAEAVDGIAEVQLVITLSCSPETVFERIRLNSGGDRTERTDDSVAEIENKLQIFNARTIPLLDHYRELGVRVAEVDVKTDSDPAAIVGIIESSSHNNCDQKVRK